MPVGSGSNFKILICRIRIRSRIRPKMDRIRNPAYMCYTPPPVAVLRVYPARDVGARRGHPARPAPVPGHRLRPAQARRQGKAGTVQVPYRTVRYVPMCPLGIHLPGRYAVLLHIFIFSVADLYRAFWARIWVHFFRHGSGSQGTGSHGSGSFLISTGAHGYFKM